MIIVAALAAALCAIGLAQTLAGWFLVWCFARRPRREPMARPPITVLKPLHGDEPLLDAALASVCRQNYPVFQVVFGVQDPADPAIGVVRKLQSRFSSRELTLIVDATHHGPNRKVGNLINMLPSARHDLLVIADSDLHCAPDYLSRIAAVLETPGTGLATTLYVGLPAERRFPALLGATQITHAFLPGALLSRALGRQDCLGATMALHRSTLERIGGFPALVDHLADDNALGRKVAGLGLAVRLADTVPLTTVPEPTLGALFRHELRWARTIRTLAPAQFAASVLQYPILFAALALILSAGAFWAWMLLLVSSCVRAAAARGIDRALARIPGGSVPPVPLWLLPLRELMSLIVMIASYAGRDVEWRGHHLQADGPASLPAETVKDRQPG